MLSISNIIKFLSENQEKIDNVYYQNLKSFEINKEIKIDFSKKNGDILPDSFDIIFNKYIKDFYFYNKNFKNKSPIFSLFNSIFTIGDESFILNDEVDKERTIKDFIKKMDDDLFEKQLYYKFDYPKNRKFNKADIQSVLQNCYLFKNCEKFNLIKEYISDYLGVNIYILHKKNDIFDIDNSELYLTKRYNKDIQKTLPHFIIIFENEIYKPLLINKDNIVNSIIKYSENTEIIDKTWNIFKIQTNEEIMKIKMEKEKENELKKFQLETEISQKIQNNNKLNKKVEYNDIKNLKIDELRLMCKEYNVEIVKPSERTGKLINKLKGELINDLLNT